MIVFREFAKDDYTEIASFYDIHIFVKTNFTGSPCLYIIYDDDNIEGFYDLRFKRYENVDFKYATGVIDEWIDFNYEVLMKMWTNKTFINIPEWE